MSASLTRFAGALVGVAIWGLAGLLTFLSLSWSPVTDSPPVRYVARGILNGAVPYRDYFDTNFPGTYLVYMAGLAALGTSDGAFRAMDLLVLVGIAAGVFVIVAPSGKLPAAIAAGLFAVHHVAGGPESAMERDYLMCLPLVWATAATLEYMQSRQTVFLMGAGIALGFALTIKPHALILAGGLAVASILSQGTARAGAMAAAVTLASIGLPVVGVVLWLGLAGGLGPFVDIVVGYLLPLYSKLGRAPMRELLLFYPRRYLAIRMLVASGLLALWWTRRWDRRATVLACGLVYGWLHFFVQGQGNHYHTYPLVLYSVAVAGIGLGAAFSSGAPWLAVAQLGLAIGTAAVSSYLGLHPTRYAEDAGKVTRQLVAELAPIVKPGDRVQVFETTAGGIRMLELLEIQQPTRFIYDFPLFHDVTSPYVQRLRREVLMGLDRHPPRAVVVYEYGWPAGDYSRVETFPELKAWLEAHCETITRQASYRICHVKR